MPAPRYPVFTSLSWLAVTGLGAATLFSQLGRLSWFFDLWTHFPLQIALGLILATGAALALRRWRLACIAALLSIPNLVALSYYFPAQEDPPSTPNLRVLVFNVLTSNPAHEEALDYLSRSDSDLILVIETDWAWIDALAPLKRDHPHVVKVPRGDNFGMALYSRHPIESSRFLEIEGSRVPCLSAIVSVHGKRIHVIGGHPVPPVGRAGAASRNEYLVTLGELALASDHPTIVLGDFNVTVWSPHFRDFIKVSGLRDTGRKRGFQASWQRERLPFAIPIDHILHGTDFICTGRTIGPNLGSDHRPVIAELAFRSPPDD